MIILSTFISRMLGAVGCIFLASQQPVLPAYGATPSGIGRTTEDMSAEQIVRGLVTQTARFDDKLDLLKTKAQERARRFSFGDDHAFYGKGAATAPKAAHGPINEDLARAFMSAADKAAFAIVTSPTTGEGPTSVATGVATAVQLDVLRSSCLSVGDRRVWALEEKLLPPALPTRKAVAEAIRTGSLPAGNRLNFNAQSYCSWKVYNEVLPRDRGARTAFRRVLGQEALRGLPEITAKAKSSAAEASSRAASAASSTAAKRSGVENSESGGMASLVEAPTAAATTTIAGSPVAPLFATRLTGSLEGLAAGIESLLNSFVAEGYLGAWQFTAGGGSEAGSYPDEVDVELWEEGRPAEFMLLLDDVPEMQAAMLLQEEGTRFYPQYVGSVLAAFIESTGPNSGPNSGSGGSKRGVSASVPPRATWEEYYIDPRRSADPDLFEPKQVLMEWHIGEL
mmetsp:Transcript_53147/g.105402  ORF Transcript_53147/g.105402 Transcript_53147/m.105402 type:complete len:453 (-) Transcript_53147:319-1677(-)